MVGSLPELSMASRLASLHPHQPTCSPATIARNPCFAQRWTSLSSAVELCIINGHSCSRASSACCSLPRHSQTAPPPSSALSPLSASATSSPSSIAAASSSSSSSSSPSSITAASSSSSSSSTSVVAESEEAVGVTESGQFSISDDELASRGFCLHSAMDGIDFDQLNTLFVKVGFPRRQKEKLRRALQHTSSLKWLEERSSGTLVAFARATGDDVFNAIIWDVVVDPSYQGMGLGKAVMERLMVDLVRRGITNISLYAEPNVVGFYKPLGYISDPQGIRAMAYSRRSK